MKADALTLSPPTRSWRPSALLRGSMALHLAALALVLWHPAWWGWALATLLADHLLLALLGLTPRSALLGANWRRLPPGAAARRQIALTVDDGPDPHVTPALLRILAEHGAHVTFFCIGERVRRHPALVRACVQGGHAIENHSFRHGHGFALLGVRGLRRELELAQRAIQRVAGSAPRFFRAPAGLRSPLLDPVLQRLGLRLVSWSRRGLDTVSRDADRVLARLTHRLRAGDILLLHDGNTARSHTGQPVVLEVLPRLLQRLREQGLATVTLRELLADGTAPPGDGTIHRI